MRPQAGVKRSETPEQDTKKQNPEGVKGERKAGSGERKAKNKENEAERGANNFNF